MEKVNFNKFLILFTAGKYKLDAEKQERVEGLQNIYGKISRNELYDNETFKHEETVLNLKNAVAKASLDFYKCFNPEGNPINQT